MKIINHLIMIFGVSFFVVCCSRARDQQKINNDTLKVVQPKNYDYEDFKAEIIKPYLDTLNSYKVGLKLPSFLYDADLDVNSEINNWPNSNFVSLREEIFKKVTNVEALKTIISDSFFEHQFDGIRHREAIPSDGISNVILAKERLNALNKK
jgi:hypothetical protein